MDSNGPIVPSCRSVSVAAATVEEIWGRGHMSRKIARASGHQWEIGTRPSSADRHGDGWQRPAKAKAPRKSIKKTKAKAPIMKQAKAPQQYGNADSWADSSWCKKGGGIALALALLDDTPSSLKAGVPPWPTLCNGIGLTGVALSCLMVPACQNPKYLGFD